MPIDFIIVIAAIATVAVITIFFNKKAIIKRKLKNARYKNMRHFVTGETAKIIGRVESVDEPVIAPLSGRKCAHFHVVIEQYVSSGKSGHWKTIIEEERSNTFLFKDEDRYAYINDKNIKSYIVHDREYRSGFLNDASQQLKDYLAKHGHNSENYFGMNKKLRYIEGILEEREAVAVLGKGHWTDARQIGLPGRYGNVLVMGATDKGIYLSDDPDTVKIVS